MRKYWREIMIGILCLMLFTVTINCVVIQSRYNVLRECNEQTILALVNQTQLVVELRQKLIPKDFESLDELRSWVDDWEKNNKPIALSVLNRTFVVSGNSELYSAYWDCDDISEAMQRDALKDGYLMSIALVDENGCVLNVKVSNLGWHVGCTVAIENGFYFIEPQTGEIVFVVRRD